MDRTKEIKRVVQLGKPDDILKRWCKANEKGGFDLQGQLNLSDVIYLLSANERLRIENKELEYLLDCRAGKLLKEDKYFVVVAIDEEYFPVVYRMIKESEMKKGRWTEYDEYDMQQALKEGKDNG